jgi:serine/threonine protein kinase/tetratricopeptide (TPR) repeat protein
MNRDEWVRVKALVADALELPQAEREEYIASRCGADSSLQREALSLVDSASRAADLYETPSVRRSDLLALIGEGDDPRDPVVGERIGAYRVVGEIGRGGMGTAYLATRADDAYEKRVAIKLIKRGMDSDAILQRFRRERQILANLEHPNIVALLDGGTTQDGRPYFVMEYVDGLPIDGYCRNHDLAVPERLRQFLQVCAAVHHAHGQRIVHRDLKPRNIMVTKNGTPKLLDFGIAKLLGTGDEAYTKEATLLAHAMTPRYASPEQLRGEPLTSLSDVYSLGVILYELVAERPPYELDGRSAREAGRIVCEAMPAPLGKEARGLDAIVFTALAKVPSQRYASVRALAEDIERYLDGVPVAARMPRQRLSSSGVRMALAAGVLLAGTGGVFLIQARIGDVDTALVTPQSIAVLPFENVGGQPDVDYLSEGLADDIINRLSKAPQLKVIARDSAFRFKGAGADPKRIWRELGVTSILTGRVVQRGSNLSVSAELVDTRDRRVIWGERYDRPATDLQALQADLAQQIAMNLRLQLPGDERGAAFRADTRDPQAYESYLRGRYFWNKRTPEALLTSVEYLSQAVAQDPMFARAYAGLADAYGLLSEYHVIPAADTNAQARDAVSKALDIDPDLPEAQISHAYFRQFYEWDFRGAEREYRRVLESNPQYSTGHQWYAEHLSAMGRHEEALAEIRRALSVDPLSLIVNSVQANILYMAGDYDRARAKALEVIALDPNFPEAYEYLKRAYDQLGLFRQAIEARQARRRVLGLDHRETPALAAAAAATDPRTYWQHRLAQEIEESRTEGFQPFEFAEIYAQAGDIERAFELLGQACAGHDFMMVYARVAPNLAPLRADSRFEDILERGCAVPPAR